MITLADIAGAGTTAPITTVNATAAWIQFIASGTGTIRIGDTSVSATQGLPVASGGGLMLPYQGHNRLYSTNQINAYIPVGATLSIAYEPFGEV